MQIGRRKPCLVAKDFGRNELFLSKSHFIRGFPLPAAAHRLGHLRSSAAKRERNAGVPHDTF